MAIITIGILAHVDAGKTSLTERILFETGVIPAAGSVNAGTTRTDTLELERARGITIQSAVVSFRLHGLTVNLIDTPGHVDFVAEVERSLRVLDAVVLVISAVEGVQSHTRRLVRAIRAIGLPLVIFINKVDRPGARPAALLDDICRSLRLRVVPMDSSTGAGTKAAAVIPRDRDDPAWRAALADLLAETDDRVIAAFERDGRDVDPHVLEATFRAQIASGTIVPVFSGSAITGAGVSGLLAGIERWLPAAAACPDAPLDGTVFKVARRPSGEKIVYARLFAGTVTVRQRVIVHGRAAAGDPIRGEERVTGIDGFTAGDPVSIGDASAGEIVVLHGLRTARIGDRILDHAVTDIDEDAREREITAAFTPPTLESVVRPVDPAQITPLREALERLADQDPLIALRQRDEAGEIALKLFGEVQKEVIAETLARDHGIAVTFGPSQTICIERPVSTGERCERIFTPENPFYATIGFRVEGDRAGSGIRYHRELDSLPLAFYRAIEETARETLIQGLSGWEVTDCVVTLVEVGFCAPLSTAADFRKLTPLVLMAALRDAGTVVCEPVENLDLDIPENTFGPVLGAVTSARGTVHDVARHGPTYRLTCAVPAAESGALERRLPALTRGEASWSSRFMGYAPVTGKSPVRSHTGPDPRNRAHYLAEVARG